MKPIVDGIEQQYADKLVFKRINADEGDGPAIMRQYRVLGHPTVLLFDQNGQETERIIGPQPTEKVAAALDKLLE